MSTSSGVLKKPQPAQYVVASRVKMLMYWHIHSAFSPACASSRTRLRLFEQAAGSAGALFLIVLFAGCAIHPEWQRLARSAGLESADVDTRYFNHRVLKNGSDADLLTIYVEGDGSPWIRENRVALDPTPGNPVMLRLMLESGHPAVYLGRPCYFGRATSRNCENRWWTFNRYGQRVVDSMCDAANQLSAGVAGVALVGYSGGGTVVVRMAGCTDRLVSVTTIAGNLDPAAWTAYHGYTPLAEEPGVDAPPLPGIRETHWQCSADGNVPPAITDAWFAARPSAVRHIVDDCTHATGWEAHLPDILVGASPKRD